MGGQEKQITVRKLFCKFEKVVIMRVIKLNNPMTEKEYFLFEEKNELRHELINNNLYEMSGVSLFHNNIVGNLYLLLRSLINNHSWQITFEAFKVKTPAGSFFYPDIMVCDNDASKYYSEHPVLIAEVLSEATRRFGLTDKFIQYQQIPSLQYYLCVEPEQQVVIFNYKHDDGEWVAETFTRDEHVISLPKLNLQFTIKNIYQS